MDATIAEGAESRGVTASLADARGSLRTLAVPRRSTGPRDLGELIVRAVEATAVSPEWRDRVQVADGFAEAVAQLVTRPEAWISVI